MKYSEARQHIQTGDVLGVRSNTPLSFFTRLVQFRMGELKGITHIGIAWWIEGRLYSVEMDGRHNVLRPLSQHFAQGFAVDVFHNPVRDSMAAQFDRATAAPITYNLWDLIRIGLRLVFGGHTGTDKDSSMVCSTFAARWMQWAGWKHGLPELPSPAELCLPLGEPVLRIEAP